MKFIVLGDIHGNFDALKSVVEDAFQTYGEEINGFLFLGDYCCDFLDGEKCVNLMKELQKKYTVYAISGNRETGMVKKYVEAKEQGLEIGWDIDSTMGAPLLACRQMTTDTLQYLSQLPDKEIVRISNAPALYLEHKFILTDEKIDYLKKNGIQYVVTAHTHEKYIGATDDFYVFNPGAVALADNGIVGSDYGILSLEDNCWRMEHRTVQYDVTKVIESIKNNEILMKHCKHWGEVLIASLETGFNIPALYMYEKKRIAKYYYSNYNGTRDFEESFLHTLPLVELCIREKRITLATNAFISLNLTRLMLDEKQEVKYPDEPWMYDMALKHVFDAAYKQDKKEYNVQKIKK